MNAARPITKKTSPLRNKKRFALLGISAALWAVIAAQGQHFDSDGRASTAERGIAASGGFEILWHTVDGGGGTSSGGGFVLSGTIGQPDAGDLAGGDFVLSGGYWQPAAAGDPGCGDCPTDVDGDGDINAFDLANLLGAWGPVTPGSACLDADGNGFIEAFDLAVLLGDWGPC